MYKVKIIGIKDDLFDFISLLRTLKIFHVDEKSTGKADFTTDREFREARVNLEGLETRIASIISNLPIVTDLEFNTSIVSRNNDEIINETTDLLKTIEPQVQTLKSRKNRLESKINQLKRYEPILRRVEPLAQKMDEKSSLESIIVMLDRRSETTMREFENEIAEKTNGIYELFHRPVDENYDAVLLLIDKSYYKDVKIYLTGERISEFAFPKELRDVNLKEMSNTITKLITDHKKELDEIKLKEQELSQLSDYKKINYLQGEILARLSEFQLAEKMGGTEDTFNIEGYIPKSKWDSFKSAITEKFGKRIVLSKTTVKKDAPVLRTNPRIVKPFEVITNMIQLPEYGSIDPTPLIFIFFPFFWGFMVGDIGYAAVIMGASLILRRRFKKNNQEALKNIAEIFIISTVWAMVFGVLYLEVFGNFGERIIHTLHEEHIIPELKPILDRYHDVQELLILSIIVGFFLIMGGLVLSIYNNFKLNHLKHVYGNFLLIIIWGSVPLILIVGIVLPDLLTTFLIGDLLVILGAILLLLRFEGIAGLIHVIEKFSNILSFARLMAIGLVGAWMGFIANDLIHPEQGESLGIFGILLGLGLHLINIVILILSPSIHAMRLNVYEFFSQFVLSGGNTYQPFGIN